jgi:enoyl-CoA hydratase/carnithine racemase
LPDLVETEVDEHGVGLLRLNRPEARNALSLEMREQIAAGLASFDADPAVRCAVIAGSEKVFAAGADIRAMAERPLDTQPSPAGLEFWRQVAATETPLIAAVAGFALGGGCELAMACDLIVADEGARFGQPEINLGIIPGGGGTQRLTRAIGKQRAMEYVLTGRLFDAKTAAEWGLVNLVVDEGRWLTEAIELARTIAARAPIAVRLGKQAVLLAEQTDLADGLTRERELFERTMATEDRVEGMNAFLEKREPEFRGK